MRKVIKKEYKTDKPKSDNTIRNNDIRMALIRSEFVHALGVEDPEFVKKVILARHNVYTNVGIGKGPGLNVKVSVHGHRRLSDVRLTFFRQA